jgi:hypothetical protein
VVPIKLLIAPSVISGWLRMIQAMPSGLSWRHRRVARALGAADLLGTLDHLQAIGGIGLALVDFVLRQLVRAHRIAAGQLGRGGIVGDRLHFEDVETAEVRDLVERQRGVVDQPGSGRMGHERLGHGKTPSEINRAAPSGAACYTLRCTVRAREGQGVWWNCAVFSPLSRPCAGIPLLPLAGVKAGPRIKSGVTGTASHRQDDLAHMVALFHPRMRGGGVGQR